MKINDIITIFVSLTHPYHDFKTEEGSFIYKFENRNYQIHFKRTDGVLENFQIEDRGVVHDAV